MRAVAAAARLLRVSADWGYAIRKLGRIDEGIGYCLQAIELDPHYVRVREYLGEAM